MITTLSRWVNAQDGFGMPGIGFANSKIGLVAGWFREDTEAWRQRTRTRASGNFLSIVVFAGNYNNRFGSYFVDEPMLLVNPPAPAAFELVF